MTILLEELSNQDIDWLSTTGDCKNISVDTLVSSMHQRSKLYILLEGDLSTGVQVGSSHWEIGRLRTGEMLGALPWLHLDPASTLIGTSCTVLEVSVPQLIEKLEQDPAFAAHLYRASAIQMSHQLDRLIQRLAAQLNLSAAILGQPQLRQGLTVFSELQDQDLDWMLAIGQVQFLAANTVLIESYRPFDALYILLDGALGLSAADAPVNGSMAAFGLSNLAMSEITRLSRGEMVGEMAYINGALSAYQVRAVRDAQLFSLPRWRLAAKLLHDVPFAARFYRVLTMLLSNKQQSILRRYCLGDTLNHRSDQTANDHQFLASVELAEARFEWMLKRIQTQFGMERELQW